MKDLNHQLKTLCRWNRDGSFSTQNGRWHMLDQMATQLHKLGYRKMRATSLKPKHVAALVATWREQGIIRLAHVRVHDLRHTYGHRLRAAGVGFEDRQDLLGHKSERMTTHYSAPDVSCLIEAAGSVCKRRPNTVLRISHTNLTQSASPAKTVQEGRV